MKISGTNTVAAPVERVWAALLDPMTLVQTIPGCERLEETGENTYAMTVTAGVAAIKGTYDGTCRLSDLDQHRSLRMQVEGAGAPGTIGATVDVRFAESGEGSTTLAYEADAVVGGMIGGVGQRMLTSVSKRMATEFFSNVERQIVSPAAPQSEQVTQQSVPSTGAQVYTAPARVSAGLDEASFLKGIAVGAGLVLLGVLVGRRAQR